MGREPEQRRPPPVGTSNLWLGDEQPKLASDQGFPRPNLLAEPPEIIVPFVHMWSDLAALVVFVAGMSWASVKLTSALGRLGARWHFSEGLVGIITALGADAPEFSSAIVALLSHHHDLGLGVVIGSNIFNLAGLLGLSALIAGRVKIGWQGLWFNGGVSLLVSAVATALLLQWIPAWLSVVLLLVIRYPGALCRAYRNESGADRALRFSFDDRELSRCCRRRLRARRSR